MKKKILVIAAMLVVAVNSYVLGANQTKKEMEETISKQYVNTTLYEFYNNYIDMREIIDYKATESELYLYTRDGSEYSWNR